MSQLGDDQPGERPEVGSVGEEAAKLFGALSTWARHQESAGAMEDGAEDAGTDAADASRPTDPLGGLADALRTVNEHLSTGSAECRYCPICQVVHAVRQTSPEVRQHLSSAAGSLLHAAAGILAATSAPPSASPGMEKIDLDGEDWEAP